MNTEKFTPGEWKIEERSMTVGDVELFGFQILTDSKRICTSQTDDPENIQTMKANAALISAAPKMYKSLKSVKIDLWALSVNPAISEQTKECIDIIIKNIEDDLKKARGEE